MKIFFTLLAFLSLPLFAFAEQIATFSSDIELSQDGTFRVTETIDYDFEGEERHGIFRFIEKKHPQEDAASGKKRYIEINIEDVTMDGAQVPYEISDSHSQVEVKIGDANTVLTGAHSYQIVYTVQGGYSYFDDGTAEIYWNVTGNSWEVPMGSVIARVHSDSSLILEESACYVGSFGETVPCEKRIVLGNPEFSASDLAPGEGLTIAQSLDGSKIDHVVLERTDRFLFSAIALFVLFASLGVIAYQFQTEHKTNKPIIAQYEPYQGLKPMYCGMLFDGRLDPHDITAGIVYLADQGFIKISKTEKKVLFMFEVDDYEIELLRPIDHVENSYLRDVLELLFSSAATVQSSVTLSSLKSDMKKQEENAKTLLKLQKDLKKDMKEAGFFQTNSSIIKILLVTGAILIALAFFTGMIALLIGTIGCAVLIFVFLYQRRTRKGNEALDHLKGFKLFLSVTDKERFAFHNAPQKSPELFMEYLPYAIALKVEKQWAEVFKDITIPNPSWYDSGGAGSFSAINLTSSLGAFSTSFAASSGASGSSGSGSSGGGGGGGGGGSW